MGSFQKMVAFLFPPENEFDNEQPVTHGNTIVFLTDGTYLVCPECSGKYPIEYHVQVGCN